MKKEIKKKWGILLIVLLIILILITQAIYNKTADSKSSPTNVILITIDTLRADHMGIYGYNKNTTPNIDKWADDAFVFKSAYTVVPITIPSLMTVMTGIHPINSKLHSNPVPEEIRSLDKNTDTLAEIFRKNHYRTAAFVTNDNLLPGLTNIEKGFDLYSHNSAWYYYDKSYNELESGPENWLEQNKNIPFFMWIHYSDPHEPYYPKPELRCIVNYSGCDALKTVPLNEVKEWRKDQAYCQTSPVASNISEKLTSLYDGEISAIDELVGKIINKVQKEGLKEKTAIILIADHGEGFDHNYFFAHGGVNYESSIRIPMIIYHPRIKPDKIRYDNLVETTDLFKTIISLMNLKYDGKAQDSIDFNQIFNPLFQNQNEDPVNKRSEVFALNDKPNKFSLFDGKYKYIYSYRDSCLNKEQQEELYDIFNDPKEQTNLIGIKTDIARNMKIALNDRIKKYKDSSNSVTKKNKNEVPQEILDKLKSLGY